MSYFSAALDSIIRELDLKQTQLARTAGIDSGQMSRYLTGESRPDVDALDRLCVAVKDRGAQLAVAYLRDEIPPSMRRHIVLEDISGASRVAEMPSESSAYPRLSGRALKLVDKISERCERSPEFVTALESLMDLMREP